MTVNSKTGDIIVVREDAVYYYTLEGRGLCFANDGVTSLVSAFQDYVALVSPPPVSGSGGSDSIRRRFGGTNTESLFNAARFTMVDPTLQIVAHSESLISEVKSVFQIWGDLYILTQDGKVRHIAILADSLLYSPNLGQSLSREIATAETRIAVSAKSIPSCHKPGAEIGYGLTATERHLPQVR